MYARLALRNLRRSFSDYAVYFVTLVFAVAVFYVFNSVGDQPALASFVESQRLRFRFMREVLSMVSVFVSFVIAILVLYANSFLIRRRRRELGTYLLLGMPQNRLAGLLLLESLLIGAVALGVGLALGVLLSQFMAVIVARLFSLSLGGLSFVISPLAMLKTLLFYGLSFVLIGLFGSLAVSRVKLAELVEGDRRNEPQLLRVTWLQVGVALISLGLIGYGYRLGLQTLGSGNIDPRNPALWQTTVLCSLGTFGLYYGMSALVFQLCSRSRRLYYRGLNPFVLRQVTSRINSSLRVLGTITVMLTVTICALGAGFALRDNLQSDHDRYAPYDFVIWGEDTPDFTPVYSRLAGLNAVTAEVQTKDSGAYLGDFYDYAFPDDNQEMQTGWLHQPDSRLGVLSLSLFNQLRAMRGYQSVQLAADRYLIYQVEQWDRVETATGQWLQDGQPIRLAGERLLPDQAQPNTDFLGSSYITGNSLTALVVADEIAAKLPIRQLSLMINLPGGSNLQLDGELADAARNVYPSGFVGLIPRYETWFDQQLTSALFVFVGLYIGVIFLMASATVLALQQLADAADNRHKYSLLSQIGAGDQLLSRALFSQLAIYFLVPVTVAAVHATVALVGFNRAIVDVGESPILRSSLVTGAIFLTIYGIYFLLTLSGYRRTLGWSR